MHNWKEETTFRVKAQKAKNIQMENHILRKSLILISFLLSLSAFAVAQESKPGEEIMTVSPGLQDTLRTYWRFYREDDWNNLFKVSNIAQNKDEFIAERKRIKADSPLGFRAILEVGLSDKMTFIRKLRRARIEGCAKILWRGRKKRMG